jgi:predicted RNase H-like HicB family nuclease
MIVSIITRKLKKGVHVRLHVIIKQDEAGYYVAEIPTLPGGLSQGKALEEAVSNIKEAIEGWLEVMESKHSFDPASLGEVTV